MKMDKRTFYKFYIFVQIVAVNAIVGGYEAEPYRTSFIKYHLCNIVSRYGKMTEWTQTKHIFGILVGFTHNIAYQSGFENSSGNTQFRLFSRLRVEYKLFKNNVIF